MSINLIPAAEISSTGLTAERKRMDIIANNLANINTAGSKNSVYKRKVAVFETLVDNKINSKNPEDSFKGVELSEISSDNSRNPVQKYQPWHPEADENGMVFTPDISPIEEMVDMITATRAYEANLSVIKESRKIVDEALKIIQK